MPNTKTVPPEATDEWARKYAEWLHCELPDGPAADPLIKGAAYVINAVLSTAPSVEPEGDRVERVARALCAKDMGGDAHGDPMVDGHWGEFEDLARAAIDAMGEPGVKAKPLEWINHAGSFSAKSIVGIYRLSPDHLGRWQWDDAPHTAEMPSSLPWRFKTPREAKAACQADYERRILSAIEPSPAEAERGRLREENERLRKALFDERFCVASTLALRRKYLEPEEVKNLEWRRDLISTALNGGENG